MVVAKLAKNNVARKGSRSIAARHGIGLRGLQLLATVYEINVLRQPRLAAFDLIVTVVTASYSHQLS